MKYLIFAVTLALTACSRPHQATLMEFCTALQRQSEADVKCYNHGDTCKFTDEMKKRHADGFEIYKSKCVDKDGRGIAPSAPVEPDTTPLPASNPNLVYHL